MFSFKKASLNAFLLSLVKVCIGGLRQIAVLQEI
jgi:hypothetical protein